MEKYTIERVLGEGRFGRASLCTDLSSGGKVVVKTLKNGVGTRQLNSFRKEVDTMRLLDHPNIIKYIDSFEDNEGLHIVMEYLEGQSLEQLLANGPVDELVGIRILYQLLLALSEIHSKKIVHKDIKPENILLDRDGNVRLEDFGIAKILEYEGNIESLLAYSQDYGAPELINEGKYDTKYDIFGAGVVTYRMFVGHVPFGNTKRWRSGQFRPFRGTLDPFLRDTITRMLNPNPRKRPTAEKILNVLEEEFGSFDEELGWVLERKTLIVHGFFPIPKFTPKRLSTRDQFSPMMKRLTKLVMKQGAKEIEGPYSGSISVVDNMDGWPPWHSLGDKIHALVVKRGVRAIGDFAFCNLPNLKKIELHPCVKSIGGSAFMGCSNLKTITIPERISKIGVSAFEGCSSLKSVILPKKLSEIRCWSFSGCAKLKEINLKNVVTIGEGAFDCTTISIKEAHFIKEDIDFMIDYGRKIKGLDEPKGAAIFSKVLKTARKYSEEGVLDAMIILTTCFEEGIGIKKDLNVSQFLRQLTQNIEKPSVLDELCSAMPPMKPWNKSLCLSFMAKHGSPEAIYQIGMNLNETNKKEALVHFQKAADMGHYKAANQVVACCKEGIGTRGIKKKALQQLGTAANGGSPDAAYQLGLMRKGENITEAFELFKKAVDGGHYGAIFELAMCYEEGRGVGTNLMEAKRLYKYAADRGDLMGMLGLLRCFSRGGRFTNQERTELSVRISQTVLEQSVDAKWNQDDELEWTFNAKQGQLIIKGKGPLDSYIEGIKQCRMTDRPYKRVPWMKYSTKIKTVYVCHGIVSIGSNAFYKCNNLTTLVIPSSVTSIGSHAFNECNSLTTVAMAEGVIEIGAFAFGHCNKLKAAAIPTSVTSIGNDAFYGCSILTKAIIPEGITEIEDATFQGCIKLKILKIPETVMKIGDYAFNCCNSLVEITIPIGVTSIISNPFSNCQQLQSIIVDENNRYFTSIDGVLFNKDISHLIACPCAKWSYVIPSSITSIGELAFFCCKILDSVVIPSNVSLIGHNAFYGCTALKSVTLPFGVASIDIGTFSDCTSLETVVIPDGVTEIGEIAFKGCSSLASISLPKSVTSIGDDSFSGCKSLKYAFVPEHLAGLEGKFPSWTWIKVR